MSDEINTTKTMLIEGTDVVATSAVMDTAKHNKDFTVFVNASLTRFLNGDWGEIESEEDRAENDNTLKSWKHFDATHIVSETIPNRILAVYKTDLVDEGKIWIIEEWDRSVITILFPSDY